MTDFHYLCILILYIGQIKLFHYFPSFYYYYDISLTWIERNLDPIICSSVIMWLERLISTCVLEIIAHNSYKQRWGHLCNNDPNLYQECFPHCTNCTGLNFITFSSIFHNLEHFRVFLQSFIFQFMLCIYFWCFNHILYFYVFLYKNRIYFRLFLIIKIVLFLIMSQMSRRSSSNNISSSICRIFN